MRPVRLVVTAFGPYAGTEEVDFDALPVDRPFVVSGPTGAGKTSLFDAMTLALYGVLPGHRSQHRDVRSAFAAPGAECRVEFTFAIGDDRWKVERTPQQVRAKLRGAGRAKVNAAAVLSRWRGGEWEPVASRIGEVDRRCRELIGLDAAQFQRVVLLPQGAFSEVLNASSSERASLLASLFDVSAHRAAVDRLGREDARLAEVLRDTREAVRAHRGTVRNRLDEVARLLSGEPPGADADAVGDTADGARILTLRSDDAVDTGDAAAGDGGDGHLPDLAELRARADELGGEPLERLRTQVTESNHAADAAREQKVRAVEVAEAVARLGDLTAELEGLEQRRAEVEGLRLSVDAATQARPVTEALAEVTAARTCREAAAEAHRVAAAELGRVLAEPRARGFVGDVPVDAVGRASLQQVVEVLSTAAGRAADLVVRGEQATELERDATRKAQDAADREVLHDGLRAELEGLEASIRCLEGLCDELRPLAGSAPTAELERQRATERVRLAAELEQAERARRGAAEASLTAAAAQDEHARRMAALDLERERLAPLAAQEPVLARRHEDTRARLVALQAVDTLTGQLVTARTAADRLAGESRGAMDAFVAGVAPRLAAELTPGEPCAVCGSPDHPRPATGDERHTVDHEEVERRRGAAEEAAAEVATLEARLQAVVESVRRTGGGDDGHHGAPADPIAAEADVLAAEDRLQEARSAQERVRGLTAEREAAAEVGRELDVAAADSATALQEADRTLAGATARLGADASTPVAELRDAAAAAEELAARAAAAAAELTRAEGALAQVRGDLTDCRNRCEDAADDLATAREAARAANQRAEEAAQEVARVCGGASPEELVRVVDRALAAARDVDAALRDLTAAEQSIEAAEHRLDKLVGASPFPTVDAAQEAALDPEEVARRSRVHRVWDDARREVEAAIGVLRGRDLPEQAPDVELAAQRARVAAEEAGGLSTRLATATAHLESARAVLEVAERATTGSTAHAERHEVVQRVLNVLRGPGNALRATLEAWVLSAHLREVVDAANVHLLTMSRGRYELEVSSDHVTGNARTGLDLAVRDAHTGDSRPTRSLSGGETFQASLALALGLADVVMAGAAGVHIDALFVDEGFGSLDGASIDLAIDVLDGLRHRGCLVGVVTHVEAMKEALPIALEVTPREDRRGSSVRHVA